MKIKYYIKEMRPHHYIKNLLIIFPLICSGKALQPTKLICGLLGFFAFCLLSSSIYIINDIKDVKTDSEHLSKRIRPIACGMISHEHAVVFSASLAIIAFGINIAACFYVNNYFPIVFFCLYFVLNIGYSMGLKNIPLLDIVILVSGFLIRTIYGAVLTDIQISNWLYLFVVFTAFFLGFGKRRNELENSEAIRPKPQIKNYPYSFLDKNMYISMALVIVFYALWTMDDSTIIAYHNNALVWTVPVIVIILMRYSLTIEGNSDGDPVEVFFKDKALICLSLVYVVIMIIILYVIKG